MRKYTLQYNTIGMMVIVSADNWVKTSLNFHGWLWGDMQHKNEVKFMQNTALLKFININIIAVTYWPPRTFDFTTFSPRILKAATFFTAWLFLHE